MPLDPKKDYSTATKEEIDAALGPIPPKSHPKERASWNAQYHQVMGQRGEAFAAGKDVEGASASGGGIDFFDRKSQAGALDSRNVALAQNSLDELGDYNAADYTYDLVKRAAVGSYDLGTENEIDQNRTDSTGYDAQMKALQGYDEALNQGGLTAMDRARFQQAQMQREGEARGQREAAMAHSAQMGRAGGNAGLLAQLTANQGSTNRLANDQLQFAALGLQRQDSLRGAQGQLGGQVQSSQDAIDRFNAAGAQDRGMRAVAAQNTRSRDVFGETNKANSEDTSSQNNALAFNAGPTGGQRGYRNDQYQRELGVRDAVGEAAAGLRGTQRDADAAHAAKVAATTNAIGQVVDTGEKVGATIATGGATGGAKKP